MKIKHLIFSAAVTIFSLFVFSGFSISSAAALNEEDPPGNVLDTDTVTAGIMDEFSKQMIIVDGNRYSFCKDLVVYNNGGVLIGSNDIEAAIEVRLFSNKGCVRKIQVLSFAH